MRKQLSTFCFTFLVFVIVLSTITFGQDQYFVLREIIHNRWDSRTRTPDRIEVNSRGGFVEFSVMYYGNCTEKYRFEFNFDQDMGVLTAGEQYGFTTQSKVLSGTCNNNRDPWMSAGAASGSSSSLIAGTNYRPIVNGMGMAGGWGDRLYSKGLFKGVKTGSFSGAFAPAVRNKLNAYSWFRFLIEGSSNIDRKSGFGYEILFVYEIVDAIETPSEEFTCPPPDCSGYPGTIPVWNFQTQSGKCWCPEGTVWNKQLNKCVSAKN